MALDSLETTYVRPTHTPRSPGWVAAGARAAALAGAATAGVLVRFGVAAGEGPVAAFNQVGRLVTGVTLGDGAWAQRGATLAGILVHFAVVATWALLFARVVHGWRGVRLWVAAAATAALAWLAGAWVLPAVLRMGHGVWAPLPQLLLLHAVLALSLGLGIRLALRPTHDEQ